MENTKKKWPFGFYVCSLTFTFERFAYYSAKWLISVFVVAEVANGGLGLTKADGALMNSFIVAFTYITPVIGGFISDRWISPRLLVPLGEILMGLGYLCAWQAHSEAMLWAMIVLVSIGTGFFKGTVSGINGRQFPKADEDTLDSIFSIQYSFVNIGSFLGTTFVSMIALAVSYRFAFLLCAIAMFVDVLWWIFGLRFIENDAGKLPFLVDNRTEKVSEKLDKETAKEDSAPLTTIEKKRVAAILLCTLFSGIFWLLWYLVYLPVYYEFGPVEQGGLGWANWNIGSFQMPTAWFDSMNGLCCIVLGPVFAAVWAKMQKRPQGDISMFKKTALGIILLGLGIVAMVVAALMSGEGEKAVGIWIIVVVAVLMSVGEMIFSPLGNSFINKFAPKKLLGTLLGVWPLIIFFSGLAYGPLYNWLGNFRFVTAFGIVAAIIIGCGVILWALSGKLDELVVKDEE